MEDITRLIVAAALGGIIGVERQSRGQYAGFRTQLLVCLGSCLFTVVSIRLSESFGGRADPGRIAAQIVTGIGFLGAGAILRHGEYIRGLTTAASLWVVSAIGMTVGFGQHLLAALATLIVLVNLIFLKNIENAFLRRRFATVKIVRRGMEEWELKPLLEAGGLKVLRRKFKFRRDLGQVEQELSLEYRDFAQLRSLFRAIQENPELLEFHVE